MAISLKHNFKGMAECTEDFTPSPAPARVNSRGCLSFEEVSDFVCQLIRKKGLFQKRAALQRRLVLLDYLFGVARHEKEFHIRAQGCDLLFELKAVDVRHHNIAHDSIDLVRVLPEDLDGLCTVFCCKQLVPTSLEGQAEQPPKRRFVFHD